MFYVEPHMSAEPLSIFIVEDDAALAGELSESLVSMGHSVAWNRGDVPLDMPHACDLILLDLGLGAADGFEVLEQLATRPGCPPVAIMSGRDGRIVESARDLARARGLRTVGSLSKPFTQSGIADMLQRLAPPIARVADGDHGRGWAPAASYYVFQAKHDLISGAVRGYEALLRVPGVRNIESWFAGLSGEESLAMTIAAADAAAALAVRLDGRRSPRGGPNIGERMMTVAFNCPPDIFGDRRMLDALRRIIADRGVDPRRIAIELTEHRGSTSAVELSSMACRYKLAGFEVHLDDFGSGSTNLEQLLRLPLNEVKIDRLLFHQLSGGDGLGLLTEIMAFCRQNAIVTTVEGIESDAARLIAIQTGADYGQGFHWGMPCLDVDGGLGA
jgi:EAL domain-containing protein (putative c-di-GMP-specific phosphodiesterase class I)/CheY-like chemotaxis protein